MLGVEVGTPAHDALRSGDLKLLDHITHLNEDKINSKKNWFEQSTMDKTRPMLTLWRNNDFPSMKDFLTYGTCKLRALYIIHMM